MRPFTVEDTRQRPGLDEIEDRVQNAIPLKLGLEWAENVARLLDAAVARQSSESLAFLLKDVHDPERELLDYIWHGRFLERIVALPPSNDDWDAVSNTAAALEAWYERNKTKKSERTRTHRTQPRVFEPLPPPSADRGVGLNYEVRALRAAIDANKRILFQLRLFTERHFRELKSSWRTEFDQLKTIGVEQGQPVLWRDFLRILVYAQFNSGITNEEWRALANGDDVMIRRLFGPNTVIDAEILLRIRAWAAIHAANAYTQSIEYKRLASKLVKAQKRVRAMTTFIKDLAAYERGGDIGLYDREKEQLAHILGDKEPWNIALRKYVHKCITCNVNAAAYRVPHTSRVYCGFECYKFQ